MHTILIKNGLLVDPGSGTLREEDLLVKDGMIAGRGAYSGEMADRVIDASGLAVLPGLVDLHVHLRDPGQEYKEDVRTGALAAARGGVTSLFAMPNTAPPVDSVETYRYVTDKAAHVSPVRVYQSATLTLGMKNEALTDMRALAAAGVKGFTEDGKSVMNASLLRDAMILAKELGLPVMEHCEDITMVRGGVMNDDANAQRLGLPGISNAVEDVIVARDCILARETGAHLHLQHCSTAGSVRIVRAAKALGVDVSAEVCPHHFAMTSDEIPGDDANYKMNPPLRTKEDAEALIEGLADGTIDCISTDHAPHGAEEKKRGFRGSLFGIVGLETSAALTYTALVRTGRISLLQMAEKMSRNPAAILGIPGGTLAEGSPADLAVFDFVRPYRIDPEQFVSKGKNTPFGGKEVYGSCRYTIAGGRIIYEADR